MYKDESKKQERDTELSKVKLEMEELKKQKIDEAKSKLKEVQKKISKEKNVKLKDVKNALIDQRPQVGRQSLNGSLIGGDPFNNNFESPLRINKDFDNYENVVVEDTD